MDFGATRHGPVEKIPGCFSLVEHSHRARAQVNSGAEISFLGYRPGWKEDLEGLILPTEYGALY